MHPRRGLHVADLTGPVVHKREHGDARRAGSQLLQVTLQEVAALTAQQHRRAAAAGSLVHVAR